AVTTIRASPTAAADTVPLPSACPPFSSGAYAVAALAVAPSLLLLLHVLGAIAADNGTRTVSPTCVCRGLHSLPRAFVRPGSSRCRCAGGGNTAADRSCCCCCSGWGASLPLAAATPARGGAASSRHRNPSPPPHGAAPSAVDTTPIIIFRC
ncbi:unnamed protein product, partial [Ectocarpus sp. 12 AP-2014]